MMTALARQELSRTEQAGFLARAALAVAAERMGGRPPEPFLKSEKALRARIIKDVRRRLKIAPDDFSDEVLRAIEDALDAEMEAVAEPVDVEAALARAAAIVSRTTRVGLEARGLTKRFKGRAVLRGIDLDVRRGEAVGILGPKGAGKTTCLYIITGLLPADQGTVCLDGTDITGLPMYRRARLGIGYLPKKASIFRGFSVEANILAVLEAVEPVAERRNAQLEQLLAEFSLTNIRGAPALELSGGEPRRVEIARVLASRPSFILLDEPLAGVDPINVVDIRNLVAHLKDRGLGVLITGNNVRDTLDIIDRGYILRKGRILTEGSPGEIIAHEGVRRVYLGDRSEQDSSDDSGAAAGD